MKTHVGRFQIVDEPEELARLAAGLLVDAARARPRCGLLLAGGATPGRAYELAAAIASPGDFAAVHVWLADDRAVPIEHAESNAGALLRLWGDALGYVDDLGAGVRMPAPRFHVMPCSRGIDKQVKELEWALAELAGNPPRPDFTLLGIGADGHTAALYAGDPALEARGFYTSARGGSRITATTRLLAASQRLVFVAAGPAKADAIARITADPRSLPAGRVAIDAKAAGADITWLLDRDAVAAIS